MLEFPGAKERLVLYKAELLGENAYDEAVKGADYVIHTASPVSLDNVHDPYKQIVDPAVEGTYSILKSCAKITTVKRVVYTSSTATVFYSHRFLNRTESDVVDESWWSNPEFCLRDGLYYHAGKTLSEQRAFEFAKDAPFDVVSMIVPCTVVGGLLQKSGVNWSSNVMLLCT